MYKIRYVRFGLDSDSGSSSQIEKERLYLIPPFSFIAKRLGNRHIIMPPIKLPMKEMYARTLK